MNISIKIKVACIFLIIGIATIAGGCTRNNGDIGNIFGTWHLDEVATDNVPDADYDRNIFWHFQNNIIMMTWEYTDTPTPSFLEAMGTWEEDDEYLFLNFTHHSGDPESPSPLYIPFKETHLPYGSISALHIEKKTSSKMILTFASQEDGKIFTYTLSKF